MLRPGRFSNVVCLLLPMMGMKECMSPCHMPWISYPSHSLACYLWCNFHFLKLIRKTHCTRHHIAGSLDIPDGIP
ncbi:hypothetical protein BDV29DRAFT_171744 [Aspergillus leporis]|uniref:Secreted protein n=1 Tax=Aspergillus leporis TaxID=41062 RepID=A0A5N5X4C7_9EURO|nr:hypothetical protein BDV29DRAFT_171744 [Aspergillus leporis]